MYFDYEDWRCQIREKTETSWSAGGPALRNVIPHTLTWYETWFYHWCDGGRQEKGAPRSKCLSATILSGKENVTVTECSSCNKRVPKHVHEYFQKAVALWRSTK